MQDHVWNKVSFFLMDVRKNLESHVVCVCGLKSN